MTRGHGLRARLWRAEALRLTAEGHPVPAVAAALGRPLRAVQRAIEGEAGAAVANRVALRTIATLRLDAIIRAYLPTARAGDASAAFVIIAAIGTQTRLEGLLAPRRLAVTLLPQPLAAGAHDALLERLAKSLDVEPSPPSPPQPPRRLSWERLPDHGENTHE